MSQSPASPTESVIGFDSGGTNDVRRRPRRAALWCAVWRQPAIISTADFRHGPIAVCGPDRPPSAGRRGAVPAGHRTRPAARAGTVSDPRYQPGPAHRPVQGDRPGENAATRRTAKEDSMKRHMVIAAVAGAAVLLAACSTGAPSGGAAATARGTPPGGSVIDQPITGTTGPNGERPSPVSEMKLTPDEIATLRAGHYTAAQLWHTSSAFINAVQRGADTEFQRLGIEVVATTSANMDAGAQANQVQTTMAKKPSVILSLPVDPVSAAQAFQPALSQGAKLVFLSNVPTGYSYGKQYSSIVTDDLFAMGKLAAEALGNSLGGKGKVGVIFYNAQYYVTNQRDAAFVDTLKKEFPAIQIVAEQGFSDASATQQIASAMLTQHPDLDGIYVSYSQPAAEGVLAALRTVSNTHR